MRRESRRWNRNEEGEEEEEEEGEREEMVLVSCKWNFAAVL